eukprot:TRINITY_DN56866_c0_g1_i1.p1 TRINITY_DN56866_c0_g1~~TRINITY_DN56866_c0_g1_i1.p1  ORF type:complete len:906 (-),score=93.87 TRINITY_DN56866_c0_g1_i1:61-2778(-)
MGDLAVDSLNSLPALLFSEGEGSGDEESKKQDKDKWGPRTRLAQRRQQVAAAVAAQNKEAREANPRSDSESEPDKSSVPREEEDCALVLVQLASIHERINADEPVPLQIPKDHIFGDLAKLLATQPRSAPSGHTETIVEAGVVVKPPTTEAGVVIKAPTVPREGNSFRRPQLAKGPPSLQWKRPLTLEVRGINLFATSCQRTTLSSPCEPASPHEFVPSERPWVPDEDGSVQNVGHSVLEDSEDIFSVPLTLASAWRPVIEGEGSDLIVALATPLYEHVAAVEWFSAETVKRTSSTLDSCDVWLFRLRSEAAADQFLAKLRGAGCVLNDFNAKYDLIEVLGQGAEGCVHRAKDRSTGRQVAVKVVKRSNPSRDLKVLHEAVALHASRGHEHVLFYEGLYLASMDWYVVTELLSGGDLFDKMLAEEECMPENSTREITEQVLLALEFIHAMCIIHRDVKPENIVFARPSTTSVRLCDFGTAIHEDKMPTLENRFCGTVGYMAPEVIEKKVYDRRADCFSCGVTAFFLLAGEMPFRGKSKNEVLFATLEKRPRVRRLEHISSHGIEFVSGMLEKDSMKRFGAPTALAHPWFARQGPAKALPVRAEVSAGEKPVLQELGIECLELIGMGSSSRVYRARWNRSDALVAVKVFQNQDVDMFREIAAFRALRHPRMVKLFAVLDVNVPALVLELCNGGSLWQFLHKGGREIACRLTQSSRLTGILDLALALAYMHSKNLVHRDVKSPNCYLQQEASLEAPTMPTVVLGDFGLTREVLSSNPAQMTKMVGTPGYMAPEVLVSSQYGPAADVFSFAFVMYEITTLQQPFRPDDFRAHLALCKGARPSLQSDCGKPLCNRASAELMQACWAQDASARPSSDVVRRALLQLGLAECRPPDNERAGNGPRRPRGAM